MYKNSALLSISAAPLLSLFLLTGCQHDVSLGFQIDGNQFAMQMKGAANPPTKKVSNTPTGAPCKKQGQPGSGEKATDGSPCTKTTMLR
jgi:hypothetical protein